MTDADLLDHIAHVRHVCDQLANSMANHSAMHDEPPHPISECTEGVARFTLGFTDIAHTATHVSRHLMTDLAEAVRELIQDWGDATGGEDTR